MNLNIFWHFRIFLIEQIGKLDLIFDSLSEISIQLCCFYSNLNLLPPVGAKAVAEFLTRDISLLDLAFKPDYIVVLL